MTRVLTALDTLYSGLKTQGHENCFCLHGESDLPGTILGSSKIYADAAIAICGADASKRFETEDLQAVFECEIVPPTVRWEDHGAASLFSAMNPSFPTAMWKPLSPDVAGTLLTSAMGHRVQIEVLRGKAFRFPTKPALPFIAALAVLCTRLRSEHGGMLHPDRPIICTLAEEGPSRISIPLSDSNAHTVPLHERWMQKLLTYDAELSLTATTAGKKLGACPALWDCLLARVRLSELNDRHGGAPLGMFAGPGTLVAGVTFAPRYIHIHW